MRQNVCKMNCAIVLYTKLPKKRFLLHFNRPKLTIYICHFVMEHPVDLPTFSPPQIAQPAQNLGREYFAQDGITPIYKIIKRNPYGR